MAKIPERRMVRTIEEMGIGETGFIVPSGIIVNHTRDAFLDNKAHVALARSERACVSIERTPEGFAVNIGDCADRWTVTEGSGSDSWLPTSRVDDTP